MSDAALLVTLTALSALWLLLTLCMAHGVTDLLLLHIYDTVDHFGPGCIP